MAFGSGLAIMLAAGAAAPSLVAVPSNAGPVPASTRSVSHVAMFAANRAPLDLRNLAGTPRRHRWTVAAAARPRDFRLDPGLAAAGEDVALPAELVAGGGGDVRTGRTTRRARMAAGLALKVSNVDGTLSPMVGMSGPVGRALTRLATEATTAIDD